MNQLNKTNNSKLNKKKKALILKMIKIKIIYCFYRINIMKLSLNQVLMYLFIQINSILNKSIIKKVYKGNFHLFLKIVKRKLFLHLKISTKMIKIYKII